LLYFGKINDDDDEEEEEEDSVNKEFSLYTMFFIME